MSQAINSTELKNIFALNGLRIRVRDFGRMVRVCPVGTAEFPKEQVAGLLNALGYTNAAGRELTGFSFNGPREISAYKAGMIINLNAYNDQLMTAKARWAENANG